MDTSALSDSYNRIVPQAERLKTALLAELDHLLKKGNVSLGVPIESRIKAWESIAEKSERKSLELDSVAKLDDLIGVRLILLFSKDLAVVSEVLNSNLMVLHSEDKSAQLGESQFGYQSQHFIVEVPDEWTKLPTWSDLGGLRVEIQVRTLAQHIWAAVSHKLQYKQEAGVPPPLRRAINRASALLETVDVEFDRLLMARDEYLEAESVVSDPDELLNVDLVEAVLTKIFPAANKRESEDYDDLLVDLVNFGIDKVGRLKEVMTRHYGQIMEEERKYVKSEGDPVYFRFVGLAREGLRCEFGSKAVSDFLNAKREEQRRINDENRGAIKIYS
ncbi:putative GTP pyrophosphokinase [Pseudomonas sp. Y3 TE3536]